MYTEVNNDENEERKYEQKEEQEKFRLREFLKAVTIAFLAAIIIKSFFFEAYKIPTGSMEKTLLAGDYIIVNKSSYELSTPGTIPLTYIDIPQWHLISFSGPSRNDVIVFKFPGYKEELMPSMDVNYIKRVVGLPGDIVQIIDKKVYVNGKNINYPETAVIDTNDIINRMERNIFPAGKSWNRDNYGPIIIPKKGMSIEITPKNIREWETIIEREFGRKVVSAEGSVISINGKPVRSYTFQKDYFFVLGDNRDDSMDSRYWGFVPFDNIIGKALIVYWSWDINHTSGFGEMLESIRPERLLKVIH